MAILSANEIWEGRGGSDDAQGGRTDTRTFLVVTDSAYETATTIKAAGVIPERRSIHPEDAGMWVVDRSFQQEAADPRVWRVTVSYASVTGLRGSLGSSGGGGSSGANELQENPLLRRAEFSFSTDKYQQEIDKDFSNPRVPIVNSSQEPFFPPLSAPRGRLVMSYTKNYSPAAFNDKLVKWQRYLGCINNDIFLDYFIPYTLLYDDFAAQDNVENGVYYWRCTFRFIANFSGWDATEVKDQGFREYAVVDGVEFYSEIYDKFGRSLTRPALLDGNGQMLDPQTADPVYLSFQLYDDVSFTVFE
jgi:hypothetical protein